MNFSHDRSSDGSRSTTVADQGRKSNKKWSPTTTRINFVPPARWKTNLKSQNRLPPQADSATRSEYERAARSRTFRAHTDRSLAAPTGATVGFFNQVQKGLTILPVLRYSFGHRKGRFKILSVLTVRLGDVRRVIGAKLADDDVAANLAISASSPVRYVERNYFSSTRCCSGQRDFAAAIFFATKSS